MIELSKLNGDSIYINEQWIETIEALPDTTITFHSGNKIVVLDPMGLLLAKIVHWQQSLLPKRVKKQNPQDRQKKSK
ncbi:flagellar FlbD family protein [bacterium]|nr:flagellar FlbD family protein [bacterium]